MWTILTAFRTFRGVRWAPGLTGMFTVEDVVHRLCCPAKDCARCSAMASKVALDPEFQARLARAARQTLSVLRRTTATRTGRSSCSTTSPRT